MKINEIIDMYYALTSISDKRLPIRVAFVISENLKKIAGTAENAVTVRSKIVQKYGEKDKDGNVIINEDGSIKVTDAEATKRELDELLNTEVNVDFNTITMDDIERCDDPKFDAITPKEASALKPMIKQQEDNGDGD